MQNHDVTARRRAGRTEWCWQDHISRSLIRDELGIGNSVNADTIARGLAGFHPESAARPAGRVLLAFLWLPTAELAKARVRQRVQEGGHFVPPDVVERRHARGVANLRTTFLPLPHAEWLFDASCSPPRLAAAGAPASLTAQAPAVLARILGTTR